jgi:MFS superfamily sulfate permease-like transporter
MRISDDMLLGILFGIFISFFFFLKLVLQFTRPVENPV